MADRACFVVAQTFANKLQFQSLCRVILNSNGVFVFLFFFLFSLKIFFGLNWRVRNAKLYLLEQNCRGGMSPRRMAETKGTDGCP